MKWIKPTFDYSDNAQDHNDNLLLDSDSSIWTNRSEDKSRSEK